MTEELKAIFFDIDDTFFSTSEFAKSARLNSVSGMISAGLRMRTDECLQELEEVINEFSSNYSMHFDKLLQRIPKEKYEPINPAVIIAAGVVAYHETKNKNLAPYPDVVGVLQLLTKTKLIRGVITAGLQIKQAEKLVRLKLLPYLTSYAIFITEQLGIGKPNPKLFTKVSQILSFEPNTCMYVGDNPINDIEPAKKAGFITVLNRRSGKYLEVSSNIESDYIIHDMWELLHLLTDEFNIKIDDSYNR